MLHLIPSTLRNDLDAMWKRFRDPFFAETPAWLQDMTMTQFAAITPAIDIEETNDAFIVHAEMPGLEKDEFSVEFKNGYLRIRGEKKQEAKMEERNYRWVERSYGSFERSVQLPNYVDVEQATAEYRNGILTVHLPKTETGKIKEIPIQFH